MNQKWPVLIYFINIMDRSSMYSRDPIAWSLRADLNSASSFVLAAIFVFICIFAYAIAAFSAYALFSSSVILPLLAVYIVFIHLHYNPGERGLQIRFTVPLGARPASSSARYHQARLVIGLRTLNRVFTSNLLKCPLRALAFILNSFCLKSKSITPRFPQFPVAVTAGIWKGSFKNCVKNILPPLGKMFKLSANWGVLFNREVMI